MGTLTEVASGADWATVMYYSMDITGEDEQPSKNTRCEGGAARSVCLGTEESKVEVWRAGRSLSALITVLNFFCLGTALQFWVQLPPNRRWLDANCRRNAPSHRQLWFQVHFSWGPG